MFGKLKAVINEIESLWTFVSKHGDQIAQLQKDLLAVKKDVKSLTPAKPVAKKTTK
jgi:hypothetical protein